MKTFLSKNSRWLFNALLVLLIWIPIPLGSNRPWAWSIVEFYSFLLLLIWLIRFAPHYSFEKIKNYRSLLLVFGFVQLWVFIQQIPLPLELLQLIDEDKAELFRIAGAEKGSLSLDPTATYVQLLKGLSYFSILFLTLVLTDTEKRLKHLVYVMIITGIIQASYGIILVLTKSDHLLFASPRSVDLATGSFMYRNHFANFLMLTLSLGIGMMVGRLSSSRQKKAKQQLLSLINTIFSTKALLRVGLIFMVIALVLSRSRMGNTAFFASMTLCSLFALMFMTNKTKGLIWLFGSLFIIDVLIVSSWFGLEKVQERIAATSSEQETRDEVDLYGLELVKKYPMAGTGAGSFYSSFQSVQGPGIKSYYDYAHNEYLQFSIEYGLPVTLLLGLAVLWSLWHAQYALRKKHHSLMKGIAFGSMMAIIGELIHISVDFNLQPTANAVYFIIILALAWMSRYLNFIKRKR